MKWLSALTVVVVAGVACSDPFKPTTDNVIGDYTARAFTVTEPSGTRNLLTAGAVFVISLTREDTTFGYLYIPGVAKGAPILSTACWEPGRSPVTRSISRRRAIPSSAT